jgi:VWFA-related protein
VPDTADAPSQSVGPYGKLRFGAARHNVEVSRCRRGDCMTAFSVRKRRRTAVSSGFEKRRSARGLLFLWALLPLVVWPVRGFAQNVSRQELGQELRFYEAPYQPLPPSKIQVSVSDVEVDVVVRDPQGRTVDHLQRQDFQLDDNGKPQAITEFLIERAAPEETSTQPRPAGSAPAETAPPAPSAAGAPRSIALFFDNRSSPFSDLHYAQQAAEQFVQNSLHAGDEVGVFAASGAVTQDFTADTGKLLAAIRALHPAPLGSAQAPGCSPPPTRYAMGPYAAYRIQAGDSDVATLYSCAPPPRPGMSSEPTDAEAEARSVLGQTELQVRYILAGLQAVIAHLASRPGQRIVVLISSGFFTSSLEPQQEEVVESALRAGVVISALDAKGLPVSSMDLSHPNPGTPAGMLPPPGLESDILSGQWTANNAAMDEMARDTGGTFFHHNNDLAAGLRQVAALPEVSYRLAFSPANLQENGRFHHLRVRVTAPGRLSVQTRRGYFAPSPAARIARARLDRFDQEMLGADETTQLPVEVGTEVGRLASGGGFAVISLHLSPNALSFGKVQGRYLDTLNMAAGLFGPGGSYVAGDMSVAEMNLTKTTLAYLNKGRINATLPVQAPAGDYRLRIAVEDMRTGQLFANSRSIHIP